MKTNVRLTPFSEKSTPKKVLSLLLNTLALLAAAAFLTVVTLWFAHGDYPAELFGSYLKNRAIVALSFIPVFYLLLLLWFITGRSWLSFLITAVITLGLTLGNFFKLRFRDDPLLFSDLLSLREARQMAGHYSVVLSAGIIAVLAVSLVIVLLFALLSVKKFKGSTRAVCALLTLALAYPVSRLYVSDELYYNATENTALINQWSSTQVFISKGFIFPFLHSVPGAFPQAPEGYDKKETAALLDSFEDADIPEEEKVNVIGIMLESFCDFSDFDQLEFASDIYGDLHALEAESYSGRLVTNIFAGGTNESERAFITGFSSLENFRKNTNSYAWYFKNQGYTTTGDHPSNQWFYNRANINRHLGFDSYRFIENYYGDLTNGEVAMDNVFFPELESRCHELIAKDEPLFSFSISYQGHGPYDTAASLWGESGSFVVNQGYPEAEQNILDNYFGSISSTISELCSFVDSFRDEEEPVVIVVFGDHKPWLGDGNSVYNALGINLDLSTEEGFLNYYSTPYLIWANDAAKQALGNDFVGEGRTVGPYFLMNELFSQCGWKGPAYMQAVTDCYEQVPVINPDGLYMENGRLCEELSSQGRDALNRYLALQFYSKKYFRG